MIPSSLHLFVMFAVVATSAACSGSTSGNQASGKEAGTDATGIDATQVCNGAAVLPPIVNVTNASNGSQVCGATIQAVNDAGVGVGPNLASGCTSQIGCPTKAPSGGTLSCVYALDSVEGTETVAVTAPGFGSGTVKVTSGLQGCSGGSAASTVTVSLSFQEGPIDASCGAITSLPPTVTARNAKTGALICDPVITLLTDGASAPDAGNAGSPCAFNLGGCPTSPPDGGAISCVFALFGEAFQNQTIRVSAPGYEPTIVPNVQSGSGGCVSTPSAATQVQVALEPETADAGGDAKVSDASAHDGH